MYSRKRLFSRVMFLTPEYLQAWKDTFPNPSTSPAHYVKYLSIICPEAIKALDVEEGGWITTFSCILHLRVVSHQTCASELANCLVLLSGLSQTVTSLTLDLFIFPSQRVLNFIDKFPLLENLFVTTWYGSLANSKDSSDKLLTTINSVKSEGNSHELPTSSNPPAFTGFLNLSLGDGMEPFVPRLLSLPTGLHFRGMRLTWSNEGDASWTMALLKRCSSTLETLSIDFRSIRMSDLYFCLH